MPITKKMIVLNRFQIRLHAVLKGLCVKRTSCYDFSITQACFQLEPKVIRSSPYFPYGPISDVAWGREATPGDTIRGGDFLENRVL